MRRSMFLLAAAALLVLAPQVAQAQERAATPKLADLVPDHTFMMASLDDIGAMRAQCGRTALAKLWREEEVQQFMAPLMAMINAQMDEAEKQIGHPVRGLLDSLKGQVAIAVVEFDPLYGGEIPDAVLVADLGEGRAQFEAIHRKAMLEAGDRVRVIEAVHGGVPYQKMVLSEGIEISIGYLGNALTVTSRPDRMTAVIDAYKTGLETSLAANPAYRAVLRHTGGAGAFLRMFMNVESIVGYFGDRMDPQAVKAMDALGLSSVKGIGISSAFVAEGVRDTVFAYAPGEKKGLMSMMYASAGDGTKLLSRVPQNAFYASAGRMDFHNAYGTILEAVGQIEPYMLEQMLEGIGQAEEFLGLSIAEDLLKPLGDEMVMYAALPDAGGLMPDLVFMAKLDEPDRFLASLTQVVAKAGMIAEDSGNYTVEHRRMSFMGKTIHYVHVSQDWGDPFPVTPSFVIDGDLIVFALYPQVLKDFVARPMDAPSVLTRPDFARVRKGLPENMTSVEYMDFSVAIRHLYGTLVPIAQMMGKGREIPVDMALLPRTETVARHMFGGAWGMELRDEGAAFHAYTPMGMVPMVVGLMVPAMLFTAGMSSGMAAPDIMIQPRDPEPAIPAPPTRVPTSARAQLEEVYIGLLFHYAQSDAYPKDLGELLKSSALSDSGVLVLPGDTAPRTTASGAKTSFMYMGPAVGRIMEKQDEAVWVYEREGLSKGQRWVLFASGRVDRLDGARLEALISATKARAK